VTRHNDPQPRLPDILRPTELADFGKAFERGRHRRKALGLILAVLGLWALAQYAPQERLNAARDGAEEHGALQWPSVASMNPAADGIAAAMLAAARD